MDNVQTPDPTSKIRSIDLKIDHVLLDWNSDTSVLIPIVWISCEAFRQTQQLFQEQRIFYGNYVILKSQNRETIARLLPFSSDDAFLNSSAQGNLKISPEGCIITSIVSYDLFSSPQIAGQSIEVVGKLTINQTDISQVAEEVTLSISPFQYQNQEQLIKHPFSNKSGKVSDFLGRHLVGVWLFGTFIGVNWFNLFNLVRVVSSKNGILIKESTRIKFVEWDPAFLDACTAYSDTTIPSSNTNPLSTLRPSLKKDLSCYIVGLDHIIDELFNIVNQVSSSSKQLLKSLPRGFLFSGLPGTGKSFLAREFALNSGLQSKFVNATDLFESKEGKSEEKIRQLFQLAKRNSPFILVIDDLDSIAANRKNMSGAIEKRLLSALINELDDSFHHQPPVFVIGISSDASKLDPAIKRARRLEWYFDFSIPSMSTRLQQLDMQLSKVPFEADRHEMLQKIVDQTHGFTPADISNVCRLIIVLHIKKSSSNGTHVIQWSDIEPLLEQVSASTLAQYERKIRSSASVCDLQGMDQIISELQASLVLPFQHPQLFAEFGAKPPSGILIYGPPGVGKSKLALAVMQASHINFITVSSTDMTSKVVGESEKALSDLFKAARAAAPCILYIDQVEAISRERGLDTSEDNSSDRILSLLLTEMDGINKNKADAPVIVLGTTSKPEIMDSAVLRPGRFGQVIFIPPPDTSARLAIIRMYSKRTPCLNVPDSSWAELAAATRGYSGADIENMFKNASFRALSRNINTEGVEWQDLKESMREIRPSLLRLIVTHPYNIQVGFTFYT